MSLAKVRSGELLALAGAACVVVSLFEPWYEEIGRTSCRERA